MNFHHCSRRMSAGTRHGMPARSRRSFTATTRGSAGSFDGAPKTSTPRREYRVRVPSRTTSLPTTNAGRIFSGPKARARTPSLEIPFRSERTTVPGPTTPRASSIAAGRWCCLVAKSRRSAGSAALAGRDAADLDAPAVHGQPLPQQPRAALPAGDHREERGVEVVQQRHVGAADGAHPAEDDPLDPIHRDRDPTSPAGAEGNPAHRDEGTRPLGEQRSTRPRVQRLARRWGAVVARCDERHCQLRSRAAGT